MAVVTETENTKSRRPKRLQWIPVVAGFLRKGSQVLVGQRPENHSLAGLWEFPGGKIEAGETPEVALARELSEELGIQAEVGELKFAATHSYGEVNILILFFEILYWKGEPKAKHHLMLEWINPEDLTNRPIPEANKKMISRILKALSKSTSAEPRQGQSWQK